MKIAILLGHWGKRSRSKDRGAVSEFGVEAHIAAKLMVASAVEIEKLGHEALMLSHGNYKERQEFANLMRADAIYNFHMNSASKPGDYGLVLYDARGARNAEYADAIKSSLANIFPYRLVSKPLSRGERGWICIEWSIMPAFIMEWGFINNKEHVDFINNNIDKIAKAFAETVTSL